MAPPRAPRSFQQFIQFQDEGVDVGEANIDTVNFINGNVSRGTGESANTLTVSLIANLDGINHYPTANQDTESSLDTQITLNGNVMSNDTDSDLGDTLSVVLLTYAGESRILGTTFQSEYGNMFFQANGIWNFTLGPNARALAAGDIAQEVFGYKIDDGHGSTSSSTLTITITGTNNVPVVTDDNNHSPINTVIVGLVLVNDFDYEGTALQVDRYSITGIGVDHDAGTSTVIPGIGTIQINANGAYTFTPVTNYIGPVPAIQYVATDGVNEKPGYLSLAIIPSPEVARPKVLYTGIVSGPIAGGEGDLGAYLTIYGKNFGDAADLGTTTKVYIGGVEVADYILLDESVVYEKFQVQRIAVRVGALAGAALGVPIAITVVAGGLTSNANCTFTPNPGRIIYVSLTGDDGTGTPGDINLSFRHLQLPNRFDGGVYPILTAGDQVMVRGGDWSDSGFNTTWLRFRDAHAMGYIPDGAEGTGWVNFCAYPGEDVHYTTLSGRKGGFQGPGQAFENTTGEYVAIVDFRMDVNGGATGDAGPVNMQYTGGRWRVVNCDLGPWIAGDSASLNAAAITGKGREVFIYGNRIHGIEGTSELQNHGIYAGTATYDWEVAFNWVHDITGGSHIQFNDSDGGTGVLNTPEGLWLGFTLCRVHHNWLENSAKYGIIVADIATELGSTVGTLQMNVWNNIIIGTDLPAFRLNNRNITTDVTFAFNTIFNCMATASGTGNGAIRNENLQSSPNHIVRIFDNIISFGDDTTPECEYFYDASGVGGGSSGFNFKRNLYFANGQTPSISPSALGDNIAIVGDPLFNDAPAGDFSLAPSSPAKNSGTQALPDGFTVEDDITSIATRKFGGAPDVGAVETVEPTPYLISNPVTSGTPKANVTSTVTDGTWGNSPIGAIGKQWVFNSVDISGETTNSYKPLGNRVGGTLAVRLTATNASGASNVLVTLGTVAIGDAAPSFTTQVAISGTATIGSLLTAINGSISGFTDSITYQWKRNGAAISGATSSTYTILFADANALITVTKSAVNINEGTVSSTSNSVGPIPPPAADPVVVQFKSFELPASTGTVITLDAPVTENNRLFLALAVWNNNVYNATFTDTLGNDQTDWSGFTAQGGAGNPRTQAFEIEISASGTYSITVNPQSVSAAAGYLIEVGPCDTSTFLDIPPAYYQNDATSGFTLTMSSATTKANDLVLAFIVNDGNPTLTLGSGYSLLESPPLRPESYLQLAIATNKLSAIETPSMAVTLSGSQVACVTMIAAKGS